MKEPSDENGKFIQKFTDDQIWQAWVDSGGIKTEAAKALGMGLTQFRARLIAIRDERYPEQPRDERAAAEKVTEKANDLTDALPRTLPGGGKLIGARFSAWGVNAKDEFTQRRIKDHDDSVKGVYRFDNDEAPKWPIVDAGPPIVVKYHPGPTILRKTKVIPIPSDAQIGLLRNPDTKSVTPIHDPTALDVAKQIIAGVQPDGLVFIGDWMDWPFLSRWQQHEEFDAVNESIKIGKDELAAFCSAAGERAKDNLVMIGSNHQARPEKFLLENNRMAMRIRRGGDTSQWPVFSEQYLLHYDDLGIKFSGQYPGGEYYIAPDLVAMHAPPKAKEFDASVFHGHTHHLTMKSYVIHSHGGRRERFVYDTGCLCRTDATTDKARMLVTAVPSNQARTDWQQGMAVINIVEGKFPIHSVDLIHIQDGRALYRGQEFTASKESFKILRAA